MALTAQQIAEQKKQVEELIAGADVGLRQGALLRQVQGRAAVPVPDAAARQAGRGRRDGREGARRSPTPTSTTCRSTATRRIPDSVIQGLGRPRRLQADDPDRVRRPRLRPAAVPEDDGDPRRARRERRRVRQRPPLDRRAARSCSSAPRSSRRSGCRACSTARSSAPSRSPNRKPGPTPATCRRPRRRPTTAPRTSSTARSTTSPTAASPTS